MRSPDETKDLARRFYDEVFNQHNLKYAEEVVSERVVEHNPLDPSMGTGRDAVIATLQAILDNSPDMKVEILDLIATGDKVAVRARFSGTDSGKGWGSPMGAPATNKSFSIEGIDVVSIDDDGRFTEHYGLFDVPGMMMQLGLMPTPGGDA
jgi:steroid delta-isomerase-like uncharacterized protein